MRCRKASVPVIGWSILAIAFALASCGQKGDGGAAKANGPGKSGRSKAAVRKAPPADLSAIKAGSLQIVNGDEVSFAGLSGVGGSMNPGQSRPVLPCLWVIRSISEKNQAAAKALGVTAGNAYIQPRERDGSTSLGTLPEDGTLWLLKPFDPALTDDQLLAAFESVMTDDPWSQIEYPAAPEGLIEMLGGEDEWAQGGAKTRLAASTDPRVVDLLIAALESPDVVVRRNVADLLDERLDPRFVDPLVARLKDEDHSVRKYAIEALAKSADSRAVDPLIAMMKDPDSSVRWAAARALEVSKDPRSFEPLVGALSDADEIVRSSAASGLGVLGDRRAVEPLIAALKDSDPYVIRSAAYALGKLGDARAVGPLKALLDHEDYDVKRLAKEALSMIRAAGR